MALTQLKRLSGGLGPSFNWHTFSGLCGSSENISCRRSLVVPFFTKYFVPQYGQPQGRRNLHNILQGQPPFTDYEQERKTFNLDLPRRFNFARDVFDAWSNAEQCGQRQSNLPALWWTDDKGVEERKFTFKELEDLSCRLASALVGPCRLSPGDRLIVILPRIPEWWLVCLACIRAGIPVCPGSVLLKANDIKNRLKASQAKCIVSDHTTADCVDEVFKDCPDLKCKIYVGDSKTARPEWANFYDLIKKSSDGFTAANTKASDPMTVLFTSGTTGTPKMALHTQASLGLGHLLTGRYMLECGPQDLVWNISDTGWAKCAWNSFFSPWIQGSCIFVQNIQTFDPVNTLQMLCKFPISRLSMPPAIARELVKEKLCNYKFSRLQHAVCGGESVHPELIEKWKSGTYLDLCEVYGQTETTLVCGRYRCLHYREGSMGKAAPGLDVQIVDDGGEVLEPGQEGNLAIRVRPNRPVGLFANYLNDPELMKYSFRGDYYYTGDLAYCDEDNYIYFVGRDNEIINSAGYRIAPFEVESALFEHKAVRESAVVSSPDEVQGEIVKAFVVLNKDCLNSDLQQLARELQEHVKDITAPYKFPQQIEFVQDLPKTSSGKIRHVELREKEWRKKKKSTSPRFFP